MKQKILISLALQFDYWSQDNRWIVLITALCLIVGASAAFPISYVSQTNVWLGAALLPLSIFVTGTRRVNYIYIITAALFCILASWYDVKLFYFIGIGVFFIFAIELCFGKVNAIALALIALASPAFYQVATIIGFPIRLQLSWIAGHFLNTLGFPVTIAGNTLTVNATDFAVDDACMGLNMLSISMLMAVFILSYHYRKTSASLSFNLVVLFFGIVFLLNLICNLFRIVMLVAFRILPDDPMHDIVGLMCLIAYVVLPTYFIAGWITKRWATTVNVTWKSGMSRTSTVLILILTIATASLGFTISPEREVDHPSAVVVSSEGLEESALKDGIIKYSGDGVLIYVKPIPEFFSAEHTPLICWKGSGYAMEKIHISTVGGIQVYQARMVKGKEKLHTAWWYANGSIRTIDQMTWRLAMLKGEERFSLVNVTTSTEERLLQAINLQLNPQLGSEISSTDSSFL